MNVVSDKNVITSTVKHLGLVDTEQERGKNSRQNGEALNTVFSTIHGNSVCFLSEYLAM
jgi:hypothetical protein